MLQNIEAVIFDLDGTLIDSMWIWTQIDIDFLEKRGHKVPGNLEKEIEGKSFTETALYFKETFNLAEPIEEIKQEWIEMAKDYYQNRIQLKPGAKKLIELLKAKGMKMAIATSCSKELVEAVLEQHNIRKYFQTVVTSCEVAKGKPHPHVFLKAAEKLKVNPIHCLAFEDTVAGATAGKAAGMKVVGVYDDYAKEYQKELKERVDYFADSMEEFLRENSQVG